MITRTDACCKRNCASRTAAGLWGREERLSAVAAAERTRSACATSSEEYHDRKKRPAGGGKVRYNSMLLLLSVQTGVWANAISTSICSISHHRMH